MSKQFFLICGEVPSAKNSKRIALTNRKKANEVPTPTMRIIGSKAYLNYKKNSALQYTSLSKKFRDGLASNLSKPYYIGMFFLRGTNTKFDYNNITQAVLDMMVHHGWIEDDNANVVVPVILGHSVVGRKKSGVIIGIIPDIDHIAEYIKHIQSNIEEFI